MTHYKVLDCTLRDGGYYNNWDFDETLIASYLTGIEQSGVTHVELGLRHLQSKGFKGSAAYCTDDWLDSLNLPTGPTYGVMIDAKPYIQPGSDIHGTIEKKFKNADQSKIGLVRVACHFEDINSSEVLIKAIKSRGYIVGLNMMQINRFSPDDISKSVDLIQQWNSVDVLYFADSFGNLYFEQLQEIIACIKKSWSSEIGIHAHDNTGLALANSLKAAELGVSWIDSTVGGMGRGAGNTKTELLLNELNEKFGTKYNPERLYTLVLNEFHELQKKYGWGTNLLYFLAAKNNIHPSYVQSLIEDYPENLDKVVTALNGLRNSSNAHSFKSEEINKHLKLTDGTTGSFNASNFLEKRKVLILGNGPSLIRYKSAIEKLISKHNLYVINLNTKNRIVDESLISAYIACHDSRIALEVDSYKALKKPIILPYSRFPASIKNKIDPKQVIDFGLSEATDVFSWNEKSCTIPSRLALGYALGFASSAGSHEILMAGFDGYANSNARHQEVEDLLATYINNPKALQLKAITPSTYNHLIHDSVFNPEIC